MQTLFSGHINKESSKKDLLDMLHKNIDDLLRLYLAFLIYMIKIAEYSLIHSARKTDLLKKRSNYSEILKNSIIIFLQENLRLRDAFDKFDSHVLLESDITRQLFLQWSSSSRFKEYCDTKEKLLENDKEVVNELIGIILVESSVFQTQLEEYLINVNDDISLISYTLQNEINNFDGAIDIFTSKVISWKSEKQFAVELFNSSYDGKEELMSLIDQKLKNWDIDRVAQMDIILMQMALAEILYFETIPVKVSINEYIDLSKQFSTPRSKEFINGILDTLMKELKDQGKINKAGRGLVEN